MKKRRSNEQIHQSNRQTTQFTESRVKPRRASHAPVTVLRDGHVGRPTVQSVHCRVIAASPAQRRRLMERPGRPPGGAINKPAHRGPAGAINARQMRTSHVSNRSFTARLTNAPLRPTATASSPPPPPPPPPHRPDGDRH